MKNKKRIKTDELINTKCLEALAQGKTEFVSRSALSRFIGICDQTLTKERLKKIEEDFGIIIVNDSGKNKRDKTDELIDKKCTEALKTNKTMFTTIKDFINFAGINYTVLTKERLERIQKDFGITIAKSGKKEIQEKTDNLIDKKCAEAAKQGKMEFSSKNAFADFIGIRSNTITEKRIKRVEKDFRIVIKHNIGVREMKTKLDILINQKCVEALEQGKIEFPTLKALAEFTGVNRSSLKRRLEKIQDDFGITVIHNATPKEKQIEINKLIENKCKEALEHGKTKFPSVNSFAKFVGISHTPLTSKKIKEIEEDFGITIPNKTTPAEKQIEINKLIENKCKEALEHGKTKFPSVNSFAKFVGISHTPLTNERIKKIQKDFKISIVCNTSWETQQNQIDELINKKCLEAVKQGKMEFINLSTFADFIGKNYTVLTEKRLERIKKDFNITINNAGPAKKLANTDELINKKCKEAIKQKTTEFSSINAFADYANVGASTITEKRLKRIKEDFGITIIRNNNPKEIQIKIDKQIDNKCKEAIKEKRTNFIGIKTFADFAGINTIVLTEKRLKRIKEDFGITIVCGDTMKELQAKTDKLINDKCKEAVKQGRTEFSGIAAFANYVGLGYSAITEERLKRIEEDFNISIKKEIKISLNIQLALNELKKQNIFLESIESMVEFSSDILSKKINIEKISNEQSKAIYLLSEHFTLSEQNECSKIVEEAISQLILDSKKDFWINEIKFYIYQNGYYLSKKTITQSLKLLNYDTVEILKNTIEKRLRLALYAKESNMPKITYINSLPAINTSKDYEIFIKNSIKTQKNFLSLWKEYATLLIKNKLLGHVSKSPIPDSWDGRIESLSQINDSYARAFFLDEEHIETLKKLSYEGLASLGLLGARGTKDNIPKMFWSLSARIRGFFVFLNAKGLCLYHAKYITLTGGDISSKIMDYFSKKHSVMAMINKITSKKTAANSRIIKKFNAKNVHILGQYLVIASNPNADLLKLTQKDIESYISSAESYATPSGTMAHSEFIYDLLYNNGNQEAIRPREEKTAEQYFEKQKKLHISILSTDTFIWYKTLISQLLDVITSRTVSLASKKQHIRDIFLLLSFLDTFDHKLLRQEMKKALKVYGSSGDTPTMKEWSQKTDNMSLYNSATRTYKMLFENIELKEYAKIFDSTMFFPVNTHKSRTLIRKGMELTVYNTLQQVAFNSPAPTNTHSLKTISARTNKQLDMSWWNFTKEDLSPILPVYEWLITKLPRRKKHLKWCDINSFLQYDQTGKLIGFHFSTDKNWSNPSLDISINTLQFLFTAEEFVFLENYVNYIKEAYFNLSPIKTDGDFGEVLPLFPHHNRNDVIPDHIIDGYHVKTVFLAQWKIQELAKNGFYDSFYSKEQQERMRNYLSTINLVSIKPSSKQSTLPVDKEDLSKMSESLASRNFSVEGGIHNLRHAGATALLHLGLDLTQIMEVTGHKTENLLLDVYMHASTQDIISIARTGFPKLKDLAHATPSNRGEIFINRILSKSNDPDYILKELRDNSFITLDRSIRNPDTEIFGSNRKEYEKSTLIEDGLQIASEFHPATWKVHSHGICPVAGRCPDGTNGCCALCPLYLFNLAFAEGIIQKTEEAFIDINMLNNKMVELRQTGKVGSLEELKVEHTEVTSELFAWLDVIQKLEKQYCNINPTNSKNKIAVKTDKDTKVFRFRQVNIDEAMMNVICRAKDMGAENIRTDNYIAKISHNIYKVAVKKHDANTLERMEKEQLNWLIEEYSKSNFKEQKQLLEHYTDTILTLTNNTNKEIPNQSFPVLL